MEEVRLRTKRTAYRLLLVLIFVSIALCIGATYVLWRLTEPLSVAEMRTWAIVSTLALPAVALAGWLFGRREASVLTDGLRTGVKEVAEMADQITEIKGKTASQLRQSPVTVQVAAGALPAPQMFHKQIEGESERVDL